MNRKEKIFQYLSEYARIQTDSGFEPEADSGYIAERLGLDRSNVSRDLNELCGAVSAQWSAHAAGRSDWNR